MLLGPALGAEDADFDACWVDYIDRPRPKSVDGVYSGKREAAKRESRTGEVVDVGSITMSVGQIRALREAAKHQGAFMIQEGDHFHLQF